MRNIKMLGLLVVSAMALVAFVGTSAASAAPTLTAGGAGETLETTVIENHVLSIEGSKTECEETKFVGTTTGASAATQVVSPEYDKCKAFGFNATVTENGCEFNFSAATEAGSPDEMAPVTVQGCGSGSAEDKTKGIVIDVNVPGICRCLVDIPEQTIKSAVRYTNKTPTPSTMDIEIDFTMSGIMYDKTIDTGLCPLSGAGTGTTGTYVGKTTVKSSGGSITWSA